MQDAGLTPTMAETKKQIERERESAYWVPMVGHAIRILECFENADSELSLQEICENTRVHKSSAFRILYTLCQLGYITRKDRTGKQARYMIGGRLTEIAERMRSNQDIIAIARPLLSEIRDRFQETVNLAAFRNGDFVYLDILESRQSFRMTGQVGSRIPFHAAAVGKAIAAFLPGPVVQQLFEQNILTALTSKTLTTRARLLKAFSVIRKQGYSVDDEEVELGAYCVAAPIRDNDGIATHAISVSGPVPRIRPNRQEIIETLQRVCAILSRKLNN